MKRDQDQDDYRKACIVLGMACAGEPLDELIVRAIRAERSVAHGFGLPRFYFKGHRGPGTRPW